MAIVRKIESEAYDHQVAQVKKELQVTRAKVKPCVISNEDWWRVQKLQWEGTLKMLEKVAPANVERIKNVILKAGWYPPKNVPPTPSE